MEKEGLLYARDAADLIIRDCKNLMIGVNENQYDSALGELNLSELYFKQNNNKYGLLLIKGYRKFLKGLEDLKAEKFSEALKSFTKALDIFSSFCFNYEIFKTATYIGIACLKLNKSSSMNKYYLLAFDYLYTISEQELRELKEDKTEKFLINQVFELRNKISDPHKKFFLFMKKLEIIDKDLEPENYEMLHKEIVNILIHKKVFKFTIEHLYKYNISLDFIPDDSKIKIINKIFEIFKSKASLNTVNLLCKLLSLECSNDQVNELIKNFITEAFSEIQPIFLEKYTKIFKEEEYYAIKNCFCENLLITNLMIIELAKEIEMRIANEPSSILKDEFYIMYYQMLKDSGSSILVKYLEIWDNILLNLSEFNEVMEFNEEIDDENLDVFSVKFSEILNKFMELLNPSLNKFDEIIPEDIIITYIKRYMIIFNILIKNYLYNYKLIISADIGKKFSEIMVKIRKLIKNLNIDEVKKDSLNQFLQKVYLNYLVKVWELILIPGTFNTDEKISIKTKQQLIDQLFEKLDQIDDELICISLILQKMKNADGSEQYQSKETMLKEYIEKYIIRSVKNGDYKHILKLISMINTYPQNFLTLFTDFIDKYYINKRIDIDLEDIKLFSKIFFIKTQNIDKKIILQTWIKNLLPLISDVVINNIEKIASDNEYHKMLIIILKRDELKWKFLFRIISIFETLFDKSVNKINLEFIKNMEELYSKTNNELACRIMGSWYNVISEISQENFQFMNHSLIFNNLISILNISNAIPNNIREHKQIIKKNLDIIIKYLENTIDNEIINTDSEIVSEFIDFFDRIVSIIDNISNISKSEIRSEQYKKIFKKIRLNFLYKSWQCISSPKNLFVDDSVDQSLVDILSEKLYEYIKNFNDPVLQLSILEQRIKFINKFKEPELYNNLNSKIQRLFNGYFITLVNGKHWDEALDFIDRDNIPLEKYIDIFKPIYNSFLKKPDVSNIHHLSKLFSSRYFKSEIEQYICECGTKVDPTIKNCPKCYKPRPAPSNTEILYSWKEKFNEKFEEYFFEMVDTFIEKNAYRDAIKLIFTKYKDVSSIIIKFQPIYEKCILDPEKNKKALGMFLYINELLQDFGFKDLARKINNWIKIIMIIQKIYDDDIERHFDIILNCLNQINDPLSAIILFKKFYKNINKDILDRYSIEFYNNLSEILEEVHIFIYNNPDIPFKEIFDMYINKYFELIGKYYSEHLLKMMKSIDLKNIEKSGVLMVSLSATFLIHKISIKNPAPIYIALELLLKNWRSFPTHFQAGPYRIGVVKTVFWFMVIELIIKFITKTYSDRLISNEKLYKENLANMVKAYIDNTYYITLSPENNLLYRDALTDVIKYLKYCYEVFKFTDKTMRNIVRTSCWDKETDTILEKVIEYKNYCIYCNYNMPPNTKVCPNCGKKVEELSLDDTGIDFDAMKEFFGRE